MQRGSAVRRARLTSRVRWWRLVALGALGVALVACGGGPEEDRDADPAAAPGEDAPADIPTEPPPEASDDDRPEGSVGEHRPPDGADAACAAIDDEAPGAVIVFPGDEHPASSRAGPSPVTVEVLGCSNTFEANVVYEAYHGEDRSPTLEGNTMGGTLGEWRAFRFEETYWTPGTWRVVVLEYDAASGDRQVFDEVTFELDPA